jgi:hypothetical protein
MTLRRKIWGALLEMLGLYLAILAILAIVMWARAQGVLTMAAAFWPWITAFYLALTLTLVLGILWRERAIWSAALLVREVKPMTLKGEIWGIALFMVACWVVILAMTVPNWRLATIEATVWSWSTTFYLAVTLAMVLGTWWRWPQVRETAPSELAVFKEMLSGMPGYDEKGKRLEDRPPP